MREVLLDRTKCSREKAIGYFRVESWISRHCRRDNISSMVTNLDTRHRSDAASGVDGAGPAKGQEAATHAHA